MTNAKKIAGLMYIQYEMDKSDWINDLNHDEMFGLVKDVFFQLFGESFGFEDEIEHVDKPIKFQGDYDLPIERTV